MKTRSRYILFLLLILLASSLYAQENPLTSGIWAKFSIPTDGMYRITASELENAGLSGISENQIRVLSMPGGPLPQINSASGPALLQDLSVTVYDDGDGIMNGSDYIIFFAEGPDILRLSNTGANYSYNPYARLNYIFVGSDGNPNTRITGRVPVNTEGPVIDRYVSLKAHEITENNLLSSGRNWYGERFDAITTRNFSMEFPGAVPGGSARLTSKVMAQSFGTCQFDIQVNGTAAGQQVIDPVPDYLDPPSNNPFRYAVKGRERLAVFPVNSGNENVEVSYTFQKAAGVRSVGYLDYFLLEVECERISQMQGTIIQSADFLEEIDYTVSLSSAVPLEIWDISNGMLPVAIEDLEFDGSTIRFNDRGTPDKRYVAFNPDMLPVPAFYGPVSTSEIQFSNVDLLIITHPDFKSAADRLAGFRMQHDGLNVEVLETDDIYNVFASGREDPSAIRNLARRHYEDGDLKYLLLFGKGSFDYLGVLPFKSNFVPVYQSRNSLDPLDTYASDDYFGFLEEGEGEWREELGGNHTLEIGIGRIPVISPEEAQIVVDKLIAYNTERRGLGNWRTRLLFVADDADFNLHHRQADDLAKLVIEKDSSFQDKRLFLGSFKQVPSGGGETSPDASAALEREIRAGALIVNYTGHGNETSWTQEQILTSSMIRNWRNRDRLPLFVTATCEFGRYDDPRIISGGEIILKEQSGGGIGILSTCRPVFSSSNFNLNEAFYNALFAEEGFGRLGDVMRVTKNESVDLATDSKKVGNRNFTLLGDPSMKLAFPENEVHITSVLENGIPSDSIRSGSLVSLRGEIRNAPQFNGTIDIRLRDKAVETATIANPVYSYSERLNTLFSGSASVVNGQFEIEFIVPRNISNKEGTGQIYMYAYSSDELTDAAGGEADVFIGGSVSNNGDLQGPEIEIYFGDSTNLSRKDVNHNTLVYVRLRDNSGINTTGFGVGNDIQAILDGSGKIVLNEFYHASKNTYQSGWVIFPLDDLSEGLHSLTFKAWDVFNNPGEVTVQFEVANPGTLIIKELGNYPNPVQTETTFRFGHNRAGEDLDIWITLIDRNGQIISESYYLEQNSGANVQLPLWTVPANRKNLPSGLYLYGIRVRSRLDGATDLKYQKLLLIN
ncbi:type IX secretion system sortase PorU [Fulvivirga sedimenti]|uniref:Type IX secretion system sortase PorU n=1 Tax=Fulvivirga sedimenti TaxID=2879465 RepID=A0A9X1L1N3_9BACT|nr:type IX secretion system sortase PorU [Fulvivirga sedimenti]MCA6078994.1 type IX secretion system sortase PorU [Fulvivirga sedimenti]